MEHSSASETINNDVGATSDIFELISGWGDCKLESMALAQLAQLRSRLNSNASLVEKFSLEREQQEATERSQQSHEICEACKLIKDPRQRKVAEIRQIHLQILNNNKPADLLCTPGIFSRLEEMALDGRLDAVVAGGARCPQCRQGNDGSGINTSNILNIWKQELCQDNLVVECCLEKPCSKCLHFVTNLLEKGPNSHAESSITQDHGEPTNKKRKIVEPNEIQIPIKNIYSDIPLEETNTETFIFLKNLPVFGGELWKSPQLYIKMWELNLKLSKIPKEKWCELVYKVLKGDAKIWFDREKVLENKTWQQFVVMFVNFFNKNVQSKIKSYLTSQLHSINKIGDSLLSKQVLLVCLRAAGDDLKSLISVFHKCGVFRECYFVCTSNSYTFLQLFHAVNPDKRSHPEFAKAFQKALNVLMDQPSISLIQVLDKVL